MEKARISTVFHFTETNASTINFSHKNSYILSLCPRTHTDSIYPKMETARMFTLPSFTRLPCHHENTFIFSHTGGRELDKASIFILYPFTATTTETNTSAIRHENTFTFSVTRRPDTHPLKIPKDGQGKNYLSTPHLPDPRQTKATSVFHTRTVLSSVIKSTHAHIQGRLKNSKANIFILYTITRTARHLSFLTRRV